LKNIFSSRFSLFSSLAILDEMKKLIMMEALHETESLPKHLIPLISLVIKAIAKSNRGSLLTLTRIPRSTTWSTASRRRKCSHHHNSW
jgi:hypothetical protein